MSKPHPRNVRGDYYVEDGCCTACDVPRVEAPGLFAMTPDDHCYVCRQPETQEDVERMFSAIRCAEFQCIRYRGNDADVISRLSALGEVELSDRPPPPGTDLGVRVHVTWKTVQTAENLAASFSRYLRSERDESPRLTLPPAPGQPAPGQPAPGQPALGQPAIVQLLRYEADIRTFRFSRRGPGAHVQHDGDKDPYASGYVRDWLATLTDVCEIRWYTDEGWHSTGAWHATCF